MNNQFYKNKYKYKDKDNDKDKMIEWPKNLKTTYLGNKGYTIIKSDLTIKQQLALKRVAYGKTICSWFSSPSPKNISCI